jgi:dTDP-4-dehydrorhamnose 3,5-epimerase
MIFRETRLPGAFVIDLEKMFDDRGFFARAWCHREFEAQGLDTRLVNINVSNTLRAGTIRGIHYQDPPFAETKVVRCTRGSIFDVMVDLRPDSPTFLEWVAETLTADNGRMLYVPEGFGHAFQSLEDDTMVLYQVSEFYSPDHYRGLRYDEKEIGIEWPMGVTVLSRRDKEWGAFDLEALDPLRGLI